METILIWLGSGFAFAVGFFAGACLMGYVFGKANKRSEDQTDQSIALLRERNEIGLRQAEALEIIAQIRSRIDP